MSLAQNIVVLVALVLAAGFLSLTEIALAAARKIKLKLMAEAGDDRALKVMAIQAQSASFFAASQIGLNAVAILGGILGEAAFRPYFLELLNYVYTGAWAGQISFVLSFVFVTLLFVLFSDLMPKRLAMMAPERFAVAVINPINFFIRLCRPFSYVLNLVANLLFRLFNVNTAREDNITFDDISAVVEAGAKAGVLQQQEQHFIENVFELESRLVSSCMTTRDSVVFIDLSEPEESIRQKIALHPYSKFPVCDGVIDHVIGYVDTRDILALWLSKQSPFQINEASLRTVLIIPDTLKLSELLDKFRASKETFAVVINEYALVIGVITLSDIMVTVMGNWGSPMDESHQILERDDGSWLIDGGTAIEELKRAMGIDQLPEEENYETAAGFMMFMLRKVPKPTDSVEYAGVKFEVVDVDHYRIDQLLVKRVAPD
ncbi:hemolysin family protein [Eoetvoesiella caeni]|uniref:Polyamine export protein n=1 Tax=Eoetvoesiella caeni TaxID=645616 RepID=A0A366HHA6_9BURK|nr:hemolysin family protein [Eoetvoesiella caeni]MCI2808568.1 hemolysin family protein [Eoetvoesiella caeni]NYT55108.1 HlyC/CorC family transporter [Eoetvoesiella caeni]RBP40912.1 CBS domain containing-hemolysin-like protein [Eoetvoesiella caeni]